MSHESSVFSQKIDVEHGNNWCGEAVSHVSVSITVKRLSYLDCQGVMTPSSGPPTRTNFLIFKKFFFHSIKNNNNSVYAVDI